MRELSSIFTAHLGQKSTSLRSYSVFSRIESPNIRVDEQERGLLEFPSFKHILRRFSIEMRQLTPVTARMGIDYLAIELLKRLFNLW